MKLPPHPRTREEILSALSALRARDLDARGGRVWSYSYHAGPEVEELAAEAYVSFLGVNGLDPTAFPSLLALENQVVSMLAAHLGGGEETAGTFTSGGTESI
ncbi:MAG: aspartate aminotransferase family protein, partial [Planctomycetota bacterium]